MKYDADQDLGLLAELAGVGYFRVDAERNVTEVSPGLQQITGFTEDEVLGRPCLTLLRCPTCLRGCGVFERGQIRDARLSIYRKDGSELQVERSGACLRDDDGEIAGALETVRVVGEDCDGDAAGPAAVEALMSGLGRMFVAADGELRIRKLSRQLASLVGREAEELVGRPLAEILGDDLFGPDGALTQAIREGKRREGWRAHLVTAEGSRIPLSLSVGPIVEDDGCGHPDVRLVIMLRQDHEVDMIPVETSSFHGIVARSRDMQRVFRLVEQLEGSDSTVLVTGESGTGKELLARAIHATSSRSKKPFVAVNCAALPSELLESELFGHVKGAFTGAVRDRAGRFEVADGGTLFLDEIGDLEPSLQGKLLRALQDRTFERVGDSRTRSVDVRVIAATHVDLERAVAERRFRDDLYYRLRVIPIHVPPLRDRREDLPPLISHLLERMGARHHRAVRLSPDASRALLRHRWPGNVRELENALEYAVTVCEGQTIHLHDLPPETQRAADDPPGERVHRGGSSVTADLDAAPAPSDQGLAMSESLEADRIRTALLQTRYNRTAAARRLGISRTTLWRKMRELRL